MHGSCDVVTFGEAMVLLAADQPGPLEDVRVFRKYTAGAETNVAIGLARLGLHVGWASRLGGDSLGRFLRESMQADGIDCSHVRVVPGESTGMMFKSQAPDGSDPVTEYHRAGSAASRMRVQDVDDPWLARARHLHVTGVFAAVSEACHAVLEHAMTVMRGAGGTISFDPNLRPALWASEEAMRVGINALAGKADWVLPGLGEGHVLTGSREPENIARFYLDRGAKRVIVKLGAKGAWFTDGRISGHVPAVHVARVVDTVGAGDGFAVGVISGLLEGLALREAVMRGAWISARVVQTAGDADGLPSREVLAAAGV